MTAYEILLIQKHRNNVKFHCNPIPSKLSLLFRYLHTCRELRPLLFKGSFLSLKVYFQS